MGKDIERCFVLGLFSRKEAKNGERCENGLYAFVGTSTTMVNYFSAFPKYICSE
jgi:hypothetical protein